MRIERCAASLSEWANKTFGELKKRIRQTEKSLGLGQRCCPVARMIDTCKTLTLELDDLHRQEESYWHMRARANELKDGDRNTIYFHHKASSRRRRNRIKGLFNKDGVWKQLTGIWCILSQITTQTSSLLAVLWVLMKLWRNKAVLSNSLHGFRVCRGAPAVPHLFFADDSILFAKASLLECSVITNIISVYERAWGQRVNYEKTEVTFSKGVPAYLRREIVDG